MNTVIELGLVAVGAIAGLVGYILLKALGDMASDEVRGWLDIAPRAILRLAGARLNREQRQRLYHDEWLPELRFIMREAETRPITRAIRALRFALGLLMAAHAIARLRPPTPPAVAEDPPTADIDLVWNHNERTLYQIKHKTPDVKARAGVATVTASALQPSVSTKESPPSTDE
jgi:hypothetical protein